MPKSLFELAKDPAIGPRAGWSPHQSVAESEQLLRMFLTRMKRLMLFV